jgi:hypothetical protein
LLAQQQLPMPVEWAEESAGEWAEAELKGVLQQASQRE